jgi:hypothetical protein
MMLVRIAINKGQNMSSRNRLELVRLGRDAFDAVAIELHAGRLTPQRQISALWALVVISGEGAPERKGDLVTLAVQLASSENLGARSRAVHVAISETTILEGLAKPSPRTQVRAVVERAAQRGLEPSWMAEFVDRFMAGWLTVTGC